METKQQIWKYFDINFFLSQVGDGFYKRNRPLEYHRELSMLAHSSYSFGHDQKFYDCKMRDEYAGFMLFRDPKKTMETVY